MSQTVTCPACRTLLRSDRPIPSGISLRCPGCRKSFPSPDASVSLPAPSLFGPAFLIAITVSLLLGGSLICAALIFASRQPTPTVVHDDKVEQKSDEDAKRLAEERKKLADTQAQLDEQKRKLDHARLVAKGEQALSRNDFAEAEKFFAQALDLIPTDAETVKGLVSARSGLQTAKKVTEEDGKRKGEVEKLLAEGKQAFTDKQYAATIRALESALTIAPADRAVRSALDDARTALDTDQAEKKKLADYKTFMDTGKAALKAGRHADAVRDYQAALRLMPDDLEAQQGLKQAEAQIAAEAGKEKRLAAFTALMDRGRAAMTATRFNEAVGAFEAATKIFPDDRDGQRGLRDAKTAQRRVKLDNQQMLTKADEAMKLNQYDDARRFAADAVKNWAEDSAAEKLLRSIERLAETARAGQEAYLRAIQTGALAMATNQYAAAVTAYIEALRLVPTDLEAARQLKIARIALEREVRARVDYDRQMKLASLAMSRRAYNEAIAAYEAALKIIPDDILASTGASKARYAKAMLEGQQTMSQRKKSEAIQAFEAALVEKPGDPQATLGLRQARAMQEDPNPRKPPFRKPK